MSLIGYSSGGFKPFWFFKPNPGSAMYVPQTEEFPEYPLFGSLEMDASNRGYKEDIAKNPRLVEFQSTMKPGPSTWQRTFHHPRQGEEKLPPEWDEWQATEPDDLPSLWQKREGKPREVPKKCGRKQMLLLVEVGLVCVFFFVPSFSPLAKKRGNNLKKQSPPQKMVVEFLGGTEKQKRTRGKLFMFEKPSRIFVGLSHFEIGPMSNPVCLLSGKKHKSR